MAGLAALSIALGGCTSAERARGAQTGTGGNPAIMQPDITPGGSGAGAPAPSTAGTPGGGSGGASPAVAGQGGQSAPDAAAPSDAGEPDAGGDAAAMPPGTTHVYVGGYGSDITHFTLDRDSGALVRREAVSGGTAPSYLAIAKDGRALYAVNEGSGQSSQVVAFSIDPATGALAEINRAPSGGEGAPHLAVHPSDEYVAVAHYGSGHTSILPVRADRGLGNPVAVERGPDDGCRKAHQAVFDQSGRHLLVPCLESNYVLQFEFEGGALDYSDPPTAAAAGGPRHLALAPDERHAYLLSELDSLILSFSYDAAQGTLTPLHTIDSQDQTKGASAHIAVHPSGRFLYASNRAENSLGLFSIDAQGRVQEVAFEYTGIDTPRDFAIDPLGEYLVLANQNGTQDLRVYRIDQADGRLTHVQTVAVGGSPTFVGFVLLP